MSVTARDWYEIQCLSSGLRGGGLSESELMDLLGSDGKPLPRAYWSLLFLAAEESLVSRSGLLNFFHDFLRKAVEQRYLNTDKSKKDFHLRIANYFENREIDERKVDELPWQLREAQEWNLLMESVTDTEMFLGLMTRGRKYELTGYWLSIGGRYDMVGAHNAMIERFMRISPPEINLSSLLAWVADFLHLNAKYAGARELYEKALDITRRILGKEHPDTLTSMNNLANTLYAQGDLAGAAPLYRQTLTIKGKRLGLEHPETIQQMFTLAQILRDKGDHAESAEFYKCVLKSGEGFLKKYGPIWPDLMFIMAASHNNIAFHTDVPARNWKEAEYRYQKSIELSNKLRNPVETANVELNLLTMYLLAGADSGEKWPKVDIDRVKELTRILEEAGDKRAEKGYKLLKSLEGL